MLSTCAAFAADESMENNTTTKERSSNDSKSNKTTVDTGKRARVKTLEEFVPSEEISADKPVAFPIDI
jgi:hypothetical protein